MHALTHPFRLAWRRLVKDPAASALAVLALGLAHWGGGHMRRMIDAHPDPP